MTMSHTNRLVLDQCRRSALCTATGGVDGAAAARETGGLGVQRAQRRRRQDRLRLPGLPGGY